MFGLPRNIAATARHQTMRGLVLTGGGRSRQRTRHMITRSPSCGLSADSSAVPRGSPALPRRPTATPSFKPEGTRASPARTAPRQRTGTWPKKAQVTPLALLTGTPAANEGDVDVIRQGPEPQLVSSHRHRDESRTTVPGGGVPTTLECQGNHSL